MGKREQDFQKIAEYKARFQSLSTEVIRLRLSSHSLYKEAAIALRELLEERELAGEQTKIDSNTN